MVVGPFASARLRLAPAQVPTPSAGFRLALAQGSTLLAGLWLALAQVPMKDERGAVVATVLTDADGIAMFEKIPYGSYTVVESTPLPGYLPSGAQVTLTLDGTFVNPTEPIAVIPNERMKLTFKKVDTAGNPLAGISFALIDAQSGTVAAHAVSDEMPASKRSKRVTASKEGLYGPESHSAFSWLS